MGTGPKKSVCWAYASGPTARRCLQHPGHVGNWHNGQPSRSHYIGPPIINILLTDDHPYLRRGLVQIFIDEFPGANRRSLECSELLEQAQKQRWDVVVLELNMPGRGGLEALHELRVLCPSLPCWC